jgi:hypothetical protein
MFFVCAITLLSAPDQKGLCCGHACRFVDGRRGQWVEMVLRRKRPLQEVILPSVAVRIVTLFGQSKCCRRVNNFTTPAAHNLATLSMWLVYWHLSRVTKIEGRVWTAHHQTAEPFGSTRFNRLGVFGSHSGSRNDIIPSTYLVHCDCFVHYS